MTKPDWRQYFMDFAKVAATRSPDPRTKVGAILTIDNRIIATGFNGFVSGASEDINWKDREYVYKRVIHAEMNCISYARNQDLSNAVLYVTHSPCSECLKLIATNRILVVMYSQEYKDFDFVKQLAEDLRVILVKV